LLQAQPLEHESAVKPLDRTEAVEDGLVVQSSGEQGANGGAVLVAQGVQAAEIPLPLEAATDRNGDEETSPQKNDRRYRQDQPNDVAREKRHLFTLFVRF
jgi:hypothetical protein